jgi:sulfur relay (sulfurtransferase) complex TusBCD TusD component (DsrE family)
MAVQLWHGNKTTVFGMEDAVLSATEKSAPSSQQHQVSADPFFF